MSVYNHLDKLNIESFPDDKLQTGFSESVTEVPGFVKWITLWKANELVACCCIFEEEKKRYDTKYSMYNVAVDKRFRGKGYGQHIVRIATEQYKSLWWDVICDRETTDKLLKFYGKCGYYPRDVSDSTHGKCYNFVSNQCAKL